MMLAGIKTGKKKKKQRSAAEGSAPVASACSPAAPIAAKDTTSSPQDRNASIAEELRRSLASGDTTALAAPSASSSNRIASALDALERRGRVKQAVAPKRSHEDEDDTVVIVSATAPVAGQDASELSIQELVAQERSQSMSMAEMEARNVMRVNKKRKIKLKTMAQMDSDEEEHQQLQQAMPQVSAKAQHKAQRRDEARQLARHDQQQKMTAQCWWWLESNSFCRHRLLALGNHVSLVMAPPNRSLNPGNHFYIVPIKHTESLTACEDDVWDEMERFQASLRALYAKENKGVLFVETVLPSKGFWQTKLEAIPVPRTAWQDAPLYFKSALQEQAQEFGTHQKLLSTAPKGLRRTVPKNFDYFYIQWDAHHQGYAQLIETAAFPKDFGVDTIAGMLQLDPMRFRRHVQVSAEEERRDILAFLTKYKTFDWTVQLDDES